MTSSSGVVENVASDLILEIIRRKLFLSSFWLPMSCQRINQNRLLYKFCMDLSNYPASNMAKDFSQINIFTLCMLKFSFQKSCCNSSVIFGDLKLSFV